MSLPRTIVLIICVLSANAVVAQDQLVLLPPRVIARPDYPAQLVVLRIRDHDQVSDVTRSVRWELDRWDPDHGQLSIDPSGQLSVSSSGDRSSAVAELTAQYDGLSVNTTVELVGGQVPSPIFAREVAAVLGKAGCNLGTCHGNLHGKAGFRLSLRGDDALLDFASIVRGQGGRLVDRLNAENSLLLKKPLGQLAHQGGLRFAPNSPQAEILRRWISEGCRWNAPAGIDVPSAEPRPEELVESLSVYPANALVAAGSTTQQLCVVARFADGSARDVTRLARFEPNLPTGIEVSADGLVSVDQPVDASISVSYLAGRTASRLTFLPQIDSPWQPGASDSRIDQLVDQQLRRLQVQRQPLADDYTFVRRAHLAIAGRLPEAQEVLEYCQETNSADKRQRLVERLLNEPGYAWMWSMRWSDLLRNEQKVMSEPGAAQWHAWMTAQVAQDRPLNEFVAEMITTLGSTYEHPPASFHRTHRDPETAAESIGQVFLGVRLQCARCHNHPFDKWRQDDYYGLAAYFTTLERKQINNDPKDKFDKHIISGDEVISMSDSPAKIWHPGRATDVFPKPLGVAYQANSAAPAISAPPLPALAQWLTNDNRMFARNMANRIWFHFVGVGIVDPPDDFRDSNPASNPELLEYLTDELIASGYSARHLARLIVTSEMFARASASEPPADSPLGGARVFSGYPLRRMPAEVLLDAISTVTDVYPADATLRQDALSVAQAQVPTKASFLTTFGKPGRLLVCECERSSEVSLGQSLVLINGTETREKLAAQANRIASVLALPASDEAKIEQLYLVALARPPRTQELAHFTAYLAQAASPRAALEDLLWALINSKEFSLLR